MRKLASIRAISEVRYHPNADKLAIYKVDGWNVIDGIARYQKGAFVIYCEIDSFLPIKPEFEFLRKSSFKKMGIYEGFRLKTIRLRGILSQGLLISTDVLPVNLEYKIGDDVTEVLEIIKYEMPLPTNLNGEVAGDFSSVVIKTDEERLQNLNYSELVNQKYTVTEKLDGSSCTFYYHNEHFGVCSRNLELADSENNSLWQIARKYGLESKLSDYGDSIAIQGEIIGLGIQKNIYKLNEVNFKVFKVFDIKEGEYYSIDEMIEPSKKLGLATVPVLDRDFSLPNTVDDLLIYADSKSELSEATREGLVLYSNKAQNVHFKIISNKFLEK
ncbi:MAG: RNA ligase (TIGR02306 family) [Halioglobus sp.]|jgi:RNA ligase (TIGR02306 family)